MLFTSSRSHDIPIHVLVYIRVGARKQTPSHDKLHTRTHKHKHTYDGHYLRRWCLNIHDSLTICPPCIRSSHRVACNVGATRPNDHSIFRWYLFHSRFARRFFAISTRLVRRLVSRGCNRCKNASRVCVSRTPPRRSPIEY